MAQTTQTDWCERAKSVLPAGGFGNYDPSVVIRKGQGSRVWDENGKEYIDYLIGSGPMLVGHNHPEVMEAVQKQFTDGVTFFTSNPAGIELAEVICEAVPCAEQLRYVSTGSEADMYAMRLARAYTGRDLILKFEGGYHGMCGEALMSMAPQKLENFPRAVPDSAGIPQATRDGVLIAPFNEIEAARSLIAEYADQIAGVIVEPLQRLIPPEQGFLEALRADTKQHGIVLIFDEVVTGFRLAYGGGQELYGVTPDLCTLGKVIGGGFPMAAIAGAARIMAHFDVDKVGPDGFTFQIGTLSGNPVAAAAGLKTLEILRRDGSYQALRDTGRRIMDMLRTGADRTGIKAAIVGDPVLFDIMFAPAPVLTYRDTLKADTAHQKAFNSVLREERILKAPMKFYASLAHTEADLEATQRAISKAFRELGNL
ncbi:aspartate aminotransferase family protein [Roseovarius sp. 2305UL8-3]|uniref:aspartate aminotransferase family protein n=1 Tax=Roseovarius conchicola TaxID=3121636 RepID=UPI003527D34B